MQRIAPLFWIVVLVAASMLAVDTAMFILRSGLVADRPPLPVAQTVLRIAIVAGAVVFMFIRRDALERLTLLTAAAAAGSSMLFGFGVRSPLLSAFRLVSHLAAYALAAIVAARALAELYRRVRPARAEAQARPRL